MRRRQLRPLDAEFRVIKTDGAFGFGGVAIIYLVGKNSGVTQHLETVFCARSPKEKEQQRMFFFWYKKEERRRIETYLRSIGRQDLLKRLFNK